MSTVKDILAHKGADVVSADAEDTVLSATQNMNERGIGGVIVTRDGAMVGIFTERDVMRRVVVKQLPPAETAVGDVMTTPVVSCPSRTTLDECASLMTEKRIRHLPVMGDDGDPCGIITIGDILAHRVREQEDTIGQLTNYIQEAR